MRPYASGDLDARLIAQLPGKELHTLVALPRSGRLLVFTRPGGLYVASPEGAGEGWRIEELADPGGRVRDAVLLPGESVRVACASRAGWVRILEEWDGAWSWSTVHAEAMGFGRLAVRPGAPLVLYSTLDDGRVLRHEERAGGWATETVYLGPAGPRGVAAGRFDADPAVETLAVFGYSGRVELLSRRDKGWEVETLFVDRDKGHWLAACEVDGRNGTDELVASGYGARIVLLARPPGYGRTETRAP